LNDEQACYGKAILLHAESVLGRYFFIFCLRK